MTLDRSMDGTITVEELRESLILVMGSFKGKSKEFEEIMLDLDKDCNGVIDYSEFLTAAINKHQLLNDKNLRMAFSVIDADKSGTITINELKNTFELHTKKDDKLWRGIMKEVDMNNDGSISYEEFSDIMNNVISETYKGLGSLVGLVRQ